MFTTDGSQSGNFNPLIPTGNPHWKQMLFFSHHNVLIQSKNGTVQVHHSKQHSRWSSLFNSNSNITAMRCEHLLSCHFIFACTEQRSCHLIKYVSAVLYDLKQRLTKQPMFCSRDQFCFICWCFDWHKVACTYNPEGTSYAVSFCFIFLGFFRQPKQNRRGPFAVKTPPLIPVIIIICITYCFLPKQGPVSRRRITAGKSSCHFITKC